MSNRIDNFFNNDSDKINNQPFKITNLKENRQFVPKTELGIKLQTLRQQAIEEGMILKSPEEILAEIEVNRK
jgi:hypothetical protein